MGRKPKINFEEAVEFLGTLPDRDIADRFGVTSSYISLLRRQEGIPPYKGVMDGRRSTVRANDRAPLLMRVMTDEVVAFVCSLPLPEVRALRDLHAIPPPSGAEFIATFGMSPEQFIEVIYDSPE